MRTSTPACAGSATTRNAKQHNKPAHVTIPPGQEPYLPRPVAPRINLAISW